MLHRLMVGQRILTPSILVRVQVKQPTKTAPLRCFFCYIYCHSLQRAMHHLFIVISRTALRVRASWNLTFAKRNILLIYRSLDGFYETEG